MKVCQGKKKNTEKPEKKEKMGNKDKRNKRSGKRNKEKARHNQLDMDTEDSSTESDNSRCIVDDDELIRVVTGKVEIVDL